ncbi:hypothetical protein BDZ90DRAFT_231692 [Jaminaea rosea]|uniref:SEC7 domain-containing protein n=1 Tax=Jaminaea rosea TaxID=1569628 RepID=A0A316USE7_9BASI|nr:hypothetical protein BDZ90DRAFT_231692 [Jaminaea rosea]PWN27914.1 hypothetical protein BDZ90DRAFT_231692 [Jaminaea rosea]
MAHTHGHREGRGHGMIHEHSHLIHSEILSYTRLNASSSSSAFTFASSSNAASSSSSSSSSQHQYVPLGSHSASLTGAALVHARRKLASFAPADDGAAESGLRSAQSALFARSKDSQQLTTADDNSGPRLEPTALLHAFTVLRAQLREHPDLGTFPLPLLLAPFLHVILSPRVSAPSINRLLVYQVSPPGLRLAPSEPSVDELVLLRILAVMKELVCGTKQVDDEGQGLTLADFLPDESICEMMETALSIDLLRKTAEQNLLPMVRHLCSRLPLIPLSADQAYDGEGEHTPDHSSLAADDVESTLRRMTMPDPRGLQVNPADVDVDAQAQALSEAPEAQEEETVVAPVVGSEIAPFSLPAIKEVLRVIISLLDPHVTSHTDSMRLLGLNLLTAAFETSSAHIARFPSLRALIQDTACKYLLQLARSESFAISSYAIRCICTMFEGMKSDLKLQYELLLTFFIDQPWNESRVATAVPGRDSSDSSRRGSSSDGTAPPPAPPPPPMPRSSDKAPAQGDALALLLGVYKPMGAMSDDPLLELFLNFDCDTIGFLCRAVFAAPPGAPPGAPPSQDGLQVFALDVVLGFEQPTVTRWPEDFPPQESLKESRGRKDALLEGARRFNQKPKDGLAYFEQQGFISMKDGSRDHSIAKFLMDCPRLDKKLLGDYLSRPGNEGVLDSFLRLFDFQDKPLSEAMREMLESFRLPGESQQIARITETFSKVYFAVAPREVIKSEDAIYVLAYSVIMLNTDLHNAQNKRKMKVEDYRRNLRGVNDGSDFDPEYLGSIYENIRKREIVMPEEHVGQLGFDYAWKELLRKSRNSTRLSCPRTADFDRDMFVSSWKPLVACIAHAFSTFRDEHLLERAIAGFRQCAILASKWGMDEVFDFMIEGLARSTGLLEPSASAPLVPPNNASIEVDGSKVSVSPLSVRFGMDFKGQLAAVVLFTIANGNGEAMRDGWMPVFEIFKNLFAAGLLGEDLAQMLDVTGEVDLDGSKTPTATPRVPIPFKPKKTPGVPQPDPRAQGGGLFSTLSSYLLSPYSNAADPVAPEVTPDDVESSLCTADCVASCRLDELYAQLLNLKSRGSVLSAVRALRQLADRLTLGQLAAAAANQQQEGVRPGTPNQQQGAPAANSRGVHQLPYDPRIVFVLELLTNITCSAPSAFISEASTEAIAHLSSLLQSPKNFHPALLERAVVCLLRLVDVASGADPASASAAIELLRSLPSDVRPALSPSIIGGLRHILSKPRDRPLTAQWDPLLSLVTDSITTRTSKSIDLAYSLISTVSTLHLSSNNFVSTIQLLRDVAQAADPEPMLRDVHKREKQGYRLTLTEKKELTEYVETCRARGPMAIARLEAAKGSAAAIVAHNEKAWSQCWLTLTSALVSQCINAHKGTRQAALTSLQRVLFSSELNPSTSPPRWPLLSRARPFSPRRSLRDTRAQLWLALVAQRALAGSRAAGPLVAGARPYGEVLSRVDGNWSGQGRRRRSGRNGRSRPRERQERSLGAERLGVEGRDLPCADGGGGEERGEHSSERCRGSTGVKGRSWSASCRRGSVIGEDSLTLRVR